MSNSNELEQLEAEIAKTDKEIGAGGGAEEQQSAPSDIEQQPKPLNDEKVVNGMLMTAVAVLSPMFPSLKKVYTPETIEAISSVTVPLANKHGWDVAAWFKKYAEEIGFAAVMVPIGIGTYQAVLHDLTAKDEKPGSNDNHEEVHQLEPVKDGG